MNRGTLNLYNIDRNVKYITINISQEFYSLLRFHVVNSEI